MTKSLQQATRQSITISLLILFVEEGTPMDLKSLSHNELPYLHAVVYESLRLWPPVPVDSKIAQVDDVLPGGWRVPKGTTLVFCPHPGQTRW